MTVLDVPMSAALILVDLQRAVDHPSWGPRNNPHAEKNAALLLARWRLSDRPVYHVRHNSIEPNSTFRPGQAGNEFKPEVIPLPTDNLVIKRTNSAFVATDLEATLRAANHGALFIAGVSTSNSVEATVRMAGNLGFATYLIEDAAFTFDRTDWSGRPRSAQEVHDMSLANLHGEYCTVVSTARILAGL
jgi:nicotinamidase-related amidase